MEKNTVIASRPPLRPLARACALAAMLACVWAFALAFVGAVLCPGSAFAAQAGKAVYGLAARDAAVPVPRASGAPLSDGSTFTASIGKDATGADIPMKFEVVSAEARTLYVGSGAYSGTLASSIPETTSGDIVVPAHVLFTPAGSRSAVEYTVVAINDCAFRNCTELTSVGLPDTVERIGRYRLADMAQSNAFYNCTGLSGTLEIPESISSIAAFSFALPAGAVSKVDALVFAGDEPRLKALGLKAFANLGIEGSVALPASLERCHDGLSLSYPFENTRISEIDLSALSADLSAFPALCANMTALQDVDLPERATALSPSMFSGCTSLRSVTLPAGLSALSDHCFASCSQLRTVFYVDADAITEMGSYVFSNCGRLEGLCLPPNVTSLPASAYAKCTSLPASIELPETVSSISFSTFVDCTSVERFLAPGVTRIEGQPGTSYSMGNFMSVSKGSLKKASFPALEYIGRYAFWGGSQYSRDVNLKSFGTGEDCIVQVGGALSEIGEGAFRNSAALESVEIPESVRSMGDGAFRDCVGLKRLDFQGALSAISFSALGSQSSPQFTQFKGLSGLEKVRFMHDSGVVYGAVSYDAASALFDSGDPAAFYRVRFFRNRTSAMGATDPEAVAYVSSKATYAQIQAGIDAGLLFGEGESVPAPADFNARYNVWLFMQDVERTAQVGSGVDAYPGFIDVSKGSFLKVQPLMASSVDYSLDSEGKPVAWQPKFDVWRPDGQLCVEGEDYTVSCSRDGGKTETDDLGSATDGVGAHGSAVTVTLKPAGRSAALTFPNGASTYTWTFTIENPSVGDTFSVDLEGADRRGFFTVTKVATSAQPGEASFGREGWSSLSRPAGFESSMVRGSVNMPAVVRDAETGLSYTVVSVLSGAFADCQSLTAVTLPDTVESIGDYAFYFCAGMKKFSFPPHVREVPAHCFEHASRLQNVELPADVETVGDYAFDLGAGGSLAEVSNIGKVKRIGVRAFVGAALESADLTACTDLGAAAFAECFKLKSVELGDSLAGIPDDAFGYDISLEQIVIPASVRTISAGAFNLSTSTRSSALTRIEFEGDAHNMAIDGGAFAVKRLDGASAPLAVVFDGTACHDNTFASTVNAPVSFYGKVSFYASAVARASGDSLGWAAVPRGTAASALGAGSDTSVQVESGEVPGNFASWKLYRSQDDAAIGEVGAGGYAIGDRHSLQVAIVKLSASQAVYDGKAHAPAVVSVAANGTTFGAKDYDVSYADAQGRAVSAASVKDAGSYLVIVAGKGARCSGQAIEAFEVRPAPVSVSGCTAKGKVYDGSAFGEADTSGAVLKGAVIGEKLAGVAGVKAEFDSAHAGTRAVRLDYEQASVVAGAGAKASNYVVDAASSSADGGTASIAKRPLAVKAADLVMTAGSQPAFSADFEGFAEGEDASVLSGVLSFTCAYNPSSRVAGSFAIVPRGLSSADYDITFAPGTLTVQSGELSAGDKFPVGNLTYAVNADGKTVTLRKAAKSVTRVSVPAQVKDPAGISHKVVAIASKAFSACTKLKRATFSSAALKSVGASAFSGCTKLASVTFKSTALATIGKNAFAGTKSLKTLNIAKTTKLKTVKGAFAKAGKSGGGKLVVKVKASKKKAYKKLIAQKGGNKKLSVK